MQQDNNNNTEITFEHRIEENGTTEKKYRVTHSEKTQTRASSMTDDTQEEKKSIIRRVMMRRKNLIRRNTTNSAITAVEGPPYHTMKIETVAQLLKTDITDGLKESEIEEKHIQHGFNEMEGDGGVNPVKLMAKQFLNVMVLILVIAMAVSFAFKDWIEAGVILFIMLLNAGIGFAQEYKAEKTMDSLRQMASPTAQVIRDGHQKTVATRELVPGDIVILKNGDVVGADCRIIESFNMDIDEALLTGESLPVNKV
jgi:magnesium-transporting ATPase (P-type)